MTARGAAAAACAIALAAVAAPAPHAHKGATSRFTYNVEVYPIFRERCGRCHVDGGVGPMSLLKYEDAFPWAESLRAELLGASGGDPQDFIKAAHRQIPARELDIVLDWATGGTPEGDKSLAPAPVTFVNAWAAGTPGLTLELPAIYEMPAASFETTEEFVMAVPGGAPKLASSFDLLPGTPTIVRSAVITLRAPDGATRVLGTWFPRQSPAPMAIMPPARLESGAAIVARIHYKKTWKFEGEAMTDRSSVGFYLAE